MESIRSAILARNCPKDNWLRIFCSFVYVETKEVADSNGKVERKETQIFPRYHQLAAVNKMIDDARQNGRRHAVSLWAQRRFGKNLYHSFGRPMIWFVYAAPMVKAVFKSVIIVTDRTVLDSQLQDAVATAGSSIWGD